MSNKVKRYYLIGDETEFRETEIRLNSHLMYPQNFAEWAVKNFIEEDCFESMREAQDDGIEISIFDENKNLLSKFNVYADYDIYCVARYVD